MSFAYAQTSPPLPPPLEIGWWSLIDLPFLLPILLIALVFWPMIRQARRGFSFMNKQETFLDHQQAATARIVAQNDTVQQSVVEQYARTNAMSEKALEQSEIALRVQSEMLAELKAMKAALQQMAARA